MELHKLMLYEAINLLKKGDISAVELMNAHIEIKNKNKRLNALITEIPEKELLEKAGKADERIINAKKLKISIRKLEGIPISNKDLFCSKGVRTTAGSKMLKNFIPVYESTVTQKLLDCGAISIGKSNMDEFAMGSSNENSAFGPCINPWSKQGQDLVPGGSSGGAATTVSSFMAMGATGSDTGGSVRLPAAFTGLVGSRPTYGRCSRYGMIAFASSLDQAGILTRSVLDNAMMLESIMGYDNKDSTSLNIPVPDLSGVINSKLNKIKLGFPKSIWEDKHLPHEIRQLCDKYLSHLANQGIDIVEIELPNFDYGLALYYIIAQAEASSNLARYDGIRYGTRSVGDIKDLEELYSKTRGMNFGIEVKRRILLGTYILSAEVMEAYYIKAQKARNMLRDNFNNLFKQVDSIILPTSTGTAFPIKKEQDLMSMYLNDVYTVPTSLAELPSIAIPCGLSKTRLPLSLQIVSKKLDEETMFKIAFAIERVCDIRFDYEKKY